MKLRSAFFVVVLLLLTVTVCAAQSPMGFSPAEFYAVFDQVNSVLEGPECTYIRGDEEEGAFMLFSESLGINMMYSGNNVNALYLYYNYQSTDSEASNAGFTVFVSTLITLWSFGQIDSGVDINTVDYNAAFDEVMNVGLLILTSEGPSNYWGYRLEMNNQEENGYTEGLLKVTKVN